MLDGPNFFLLHFPIYTVPEKMGPSFGWAPGRRTSCLGLEPTLIDSEPERKPLFGKVE
jgi:hypothetical protein